MEKTTIPPTLVFTNVERLKIYAYAIIVMRRILDEPLLIRFGLCHAISKGLANLLNVDIYSDDALEKYHHVYPYDHMEQYPEIYKHEPRKLFNEEAGYWFSLTKAGIRRRIEILEGAINELASSVES